MDQARLRFLLDKFHKNKLSESEREELDNWFHDLNIEGENGIEAWMDEEGNEEKYAEKRFAELKKEISQRKKTVTLITLRKAFTAAAILLPVAVLIGFLMSPLNKSSVLAKEHSVKNDVNKTTLTLSDGKTVVLDSASNGVIAQDANVIITKNSKGEITYSVNDKSRPDVYNTITTSRGNQSPVILLPDGSKVTLDASSSIRYLISFSKNEREVDMTGQAYFEVAHNPAIPFRIKVSGQTIEDIGTRFNVNAYADEPSTKVTLEEGAIKLLKGTHSVLLHPGEQATTNKDDSSISVEEVNVADALAWKSGLLIFNNQNIQQIMRQISRQYDVDIVYEGETGKRIFTGGISKHSSLNDMLKVLSLNGIHCELSGKTITVKSL